MIFFFFSSSDSDFVRILVTASCRRKVSRLWDSNNFHLHLFNLFLVPSPYHGNASSSHRYFYFFFNRIILIIFKVECSGDLKDVWIKGYTINKLKYFKIVHNSSKLDIRELERTAKVLKFRGKNVAKKWYWFFF